MLNVRLGGVETAEEVKNSQALGMSGLKAKDALFEAIKDKGGYGYQEGLKSKVGGSHHPAQEVFGVLRDTINTLRLQAATTRVPCTLPGGWC